MEPIVRTKPRQSVPAPRNSSRAMAGMFSGFAAAVVLVAGLIAYSEYNKAQLASALQRPKAAADSVDAEMSATVKAIALDHHLKPFGIIHLSTDAKADLLPDGDVGVSGGGLDKEGRMHKVFAKYSVARFGERRQWKLTGLMIDGNVKEIVAHH